MAPLPADDRAKGTMNVRINAACLYAKQERECHCYIIGATGGFLFFFQAEDGIRGVAVTGVQTCALPILRCAGSPSDSTAGSLGGRRSTASRLIGSGRDRTPGRYGSPQWHRGVARKMWMKTDHENNPAGSV